uniref:Uncharacterized protein n=1 Tax=Anguilla anguilla TaxID=7936 RepID=A0A0E9XRM7_ANGAN
MDKINTWKKDNNIKLNIKGILCRILTLKRLQNIHAKA